MITLYLNDPYDLGKYTQDHRAYAFRCIRSFLSGETTEGQEHWLNWHGYLDRHTLSVTEKAVRLIIWAEGRLENP